MPPRCLIDAFPWPLQPPRCFPDAVLGLNSNHTSFSKRCTLIPIIQNQIYSNHAISPKFKSSLPDANETRPSQTDSDRLIQTDWVQFILNQCMSKTIPTIAATHTYTAIQIASFRHSSNQVNPKQINSNHFKPSRTKLHKTDTTRMNAMQISSTQPVQHNSTDLSTWMQAEPIQTNLDLILHTASAVGLLAVYLGNGCLVGGTIPCVRSLICVRRLRTW